MDDWGAHLNHLDTRAKEKSCPSSTSLRHEVSAQQAGVVGLEQYIGDELHNSAKRD